MPFNIFRRKKPDQQTPPEAPIQEAPPQPTPEATPEPAAPAEESIQASTPVEEPTPAATVPIEPAPFPTPSEVPMEPASAPEQTQPAEQPPVQESAETVVVEQKPPAPAEPLSKTYLKAMPLKELADLDNVETEVRNGNIIILRVTPLAGKSIEDVKKAVNELFQFAESIGGDIARLGEERVVICPKSIRIWREKTPAPVKNNKPLPTAA